MKSLSLFIDKWYIVGAVNENGSTYPLNIPNGEDRIWLFFFEDVANNRISFGKNYEQSYYDKKPSYIGDVFTALNDPNAHFTRYSNRPEELKEIFSASGIFDLLKSSVGTSDTANVYLSFSVDIEDTSKLKFINELKEHGFNIIENVARISHLALEECRKRGKCNEVGNYIVLEATNENLHFSIYELNEGFYLRKAESTLPGYGYDVRRKALIEYVVENINRTTKLLNSQNEIAQEHKRMESFANQWLRKIANSRPGLPVALPNITFSVAPNNPVSVTVIPKNLGQRTDGIVNEIVRKIADFIREAHLNTFDIKGIVFIGNTFTNEKFRSAINSRIIINDNSIVLYREVEIPKIVSVYSEIDCGQFSNATTAFFSDAAKEAERKRLAHEEAEKRRKAEEEAERERQEKEATRRTEREYELAMENVSRYEAEKDYEQMSSWADIALSHKSNDPSATDKKEQALRLLATQKEAIRQYNTLMQRAKTCFEEKRWNDAIAQCDLALELNPDSPEAKRIKKESKQQLDTKEKVAELITRVDIFMAQKLYAKAIEELDKIKFLQPDNHEANERRKKIQGIYASHSKAVQNLIDKFNSSIASGEFAEAIQVCEKLVELDSENTRQWTEKLERLKQQAEKLKERRKHLETIKQKIDEADFHDKYEDVIKLCQDYLAISEDHRISRLLEKARRNLSKLNHEKQGRELVNKVKADISDRNFEEAERSLRILRRDYPELVNEVKSLNKRMFEEQEKVDKLKPKTKEPVRKAVGFTQPKTDDFFGTEPQTNSPTKQTQRKKKTTPNKKSDDFFDEHQKGRVNSTSKNIDSISNNDFNF